MDKPVVSGSLYQSIAKDYTPKKAEMNICIYIESLERRLDELSYKLNQLEEGMRKKGAKQSGQ